MKQHRKVSKREKIVTRINFLKQLYEEKWIISNVTFNIKR